MRRILVGLVTLLALAACTDDPTVSSSEVNASSEFTTETVEEDAAPTVSPTTAAEVSTPEPEPAEPATAAQVGDGLFPTVVDATATLQDGANWRFDVTLLSEYDSPERYADAWRVLDGDDNELGIRVLGHDHANEQPFTRSTTVELPVDITTVFVEGRDQVNGWSGERFELVLVG